MTNPEIVGELQIDPAILEVLKADPRYVDLVKNFVMEAAALTVRISNEIDGLPPEDNLQWRAGSLAGDEFLLLTAALSVVLNNSFGYLQDSYIQSWGWSVEEMMGGTAFQDLESDGEKLGDILDRWGVLMEDMMEDGFTWPA